MNIKKEHIIIGSVALGGGYIFLRMRARRPIIPTSVDDFVQTFDLTPPITPPVRPTVLPPRVPTPEPGFFDRVRDIIDPIIPDVILPPRVPERPVCGFPGCAGPRPRVPEQRIPPLPRIPLPTPTLPRLPTLPRIPLPTLTQFIRPLPVKRLPASRPAPIVLTPPALPRITPPTLPNIQRRVTELIRPVPFVGRTISQPVRPRATVMPRRAAITRRRR